jgi:hypothetical protein
LLELKSKYGTVEHIKKLNSKYRPTKVAILDNSILSTSPISQHGAEDTAEADGYGEANTEPVGGNAGDLTDTAESEQPDDSRRIWSRIADGYSFVDGDSKLSPWLFASDPHGIQMANLNCAPDP